MQRDEAPLRFFIFPQERGIKGVEGNNKDNPDGSRGGYQGVGTAHPTADERQNHNLRTGLQSGNCDLRSNAAIRGSSM